MEAFKRAEIANFSKQQLFEYEESLKVMRDNINLISSAKEEGIREGKISIAKALIESGMDLKQVLKITGLSEQDLM